MTGWILRNCVRLALLIIVAVVSVAVMGCSGGDGGGDGGGTTNDTSRTIGAVGSNGGTIEVTDPNSPIKGARVIVPQGAVASGETVTITIAYEDHLPGAVTAETVSASKTIVLTKDGGSSFQKPVDVTIPYTDTEMESGDIPTVFYWDPSYNQYMAVAVKSIDTVNKTITFRTSHFSKFVALSIRGLTSSLPKVDTGFRPGIDSFSHPNFGSYLQDAEHTGYCLGMADYAEWYYVFKKSSEGKLYKQYNDGDEEYWADDVTVRELIIRAHLKWSEILAGVSSDITISDAQTGCALITAMKITGHPQTLTMKIGKVGHGVTVYKYDSGKFYIYDNNFPETEVTVDWSLTDGFSNYSEAAQYKNLGKITDFAFDALSWAEPTTFEELHNHAKKGWSTSKFKTISVTSPSIDVTNSTTVTSTSNVTITGNVDGVTGTGAYIVYSVNAAKKNGLSGELVPVGADGSFSFTIPSLPSSSNTVMMMATKDSDDYRRTVPNGYAGFKKITINVAAPSFYTLSGIVTYGTRPMQGMEVQLAGEECLGPSDWNPIATDTTSADGRYTFTNLEQGKYCMRILPSGPYHSHLYHGVNLYRDTVWPMYVEKDITVLSPADGATITEARPQFCWQGLPEADSYVLHLIYWATTPQNIYENITGTCYTVNQDLQDGWYSWEVVAYQSGSTIDPIIAQSHTFFFTHGFPPEIAMAPTQGPPGTTFTEWGTGFPPNTTATLYFRKPDGSMYDPQTVAIDAGGHFEIQYTAPMDKPSGTYTWWAVSAGGLKSNEVSYVIQ